MTFPSAGDEIYRNEDGEVLGWGKPESAEDYYCGFCGFSHGGECPTDINEDDDADYVGYDGIADNDDDVPGLVPGLDY